MNRRPLRPSLLKSALVRCFPFFLLIAFAHSQETLLGKQCDLASVGAKDTSAFLLFDKELRQALGPSQRELMPLLASTSLRINDQYGTYYVQDAQTLQSRFEQVFTPQLRNAVLGTQPTQLFCNVSGVMYGNGELWVTLTEHGYRISTINLSNNTPRPTVKTGFACTTEHFRAVIDENDDAPRLRLWQSPHSILARPDLELKHGKQELEGTGPCTHNLWSFQNGENKIVLMELGCTEDTPPTGAVGSVEISGKTTENGWCF